MGKISYRRVPDNWEHPKDDQGRFIPKYNGMEFLDRVAQWQLYEENWAKGLVYAGHDDGRVKWNPMSERDRERGIERYYGIKPDLTDFTPPITGQNITSGAWQVYEDVSEGTPISPVYPDFNALVAAVAKESGGSLAASRAKVVCTILKGWWYVPVSDFERGGSHYQGN